MDATRYTYPKTNMDTQHDALKKGDSLNICPFLVSMLDVCGSYTFPTLKTKTPTLKQKKQLGSRPDSSSSERVGDSNRILGGFSGSCQKKGQKMLKHMDVSRK